MEKNNWQKIYVQKLCFALHSLFKMIFEHYTVVECRRSRRWNCDDGTCISRDLKCDGIPHCLDASDEAINCTSGKIKVCPKMLQ